jgi:hypothetical protein
MHVIRVAWDDEPTRFKENQLRRTLMKNDRSLPAILRIRNVQLTSIHLTHRISAHVC